MTWLDVLQGLSTPTIGVAVIYIAYQQYKTNKKQVKFDLYKRRIIILNACYKFFTTTIVNRAVSLETLNEFDESTAEARFLFDKNILAYLQEINAKAFNLFTITNKLDSLLAGPERESIATKKVELVDWFICESQTCKTKFDKFLQVE